MKTTVFVNYISFSLRKMKTTIKIKR